MTRDDLFNTNISIVCDIIKVIGQVSPNALVGIISNPVSTYLGYINYLIYIIQ
jgi:malate/lactate dehydrogenase